MLSEARCPPGQPANWWWNQHSCRLQIWQYRRPPDPGPKRAALKYFSMPNSGLSCKFSLGEYSTDLFGTFWYLRENLAEYLDQRCPCHFLQWGGGRGVKIWSYTTARNGVEILDTLHCNGRLPGVPGLPCTRMSPFWILLQLRMMEVLVTNGAISRAKLQPNHHQ